MASCGSLLVEEAQSEPMWDNACVSLEGCSVNSSTIQTGETFTVSVSVSNDNEVLGSATIRVEANGSRVGSKRIQIGGGSFNTFSITCTVPSSAGTVSITTSLADVEATWMGSTPASAPASAEPGQSIGGLLASFDPASASTPIEVGAPAPSAPAGGAECCNGARTAFRSRAPTGGSAVDRAFGRFGQG
ncbi:hypothetical protein [Haloarcula amylovorans]|uniref:hypothetical protein n=1 Tax=Haloarcula amylovorans TaxID=2562280 RepID=UPI00107602E3|nr:hypothetical protein [Halomicroarcula amylolytica]